MYRAKCRFCPWGKNDNVVFAPGARTTFRSIHSTKTAVLWCSVRQHTTRTCFRAVQHSTVECCALQCCTQLHRAAVYCALMIGWLNVQYSTVQYSIAANFCFCFMGQTLHVARYCTIQHSTVQHSTFNKNKNTSMLCATVRADTVLYCAV
jgi:hypothetical protein